MRFFAADCKFWYFNNAMATIRSISAIAFLSDSESTVVTDRRNFEVISIWSRKIPPVITSHGERSLNYLIPISGN